MYGHYEINGRPQQDESSPGIDETKDTDHRNSFDKSDMIDSADTTSSVFLHNSISNNEMMHCRARRTIPQDLTSELPEQKEVRFAEKRTDEKNATALPDNYHESVRDPLIPPVGRLHQDGIGTSSTGAIPRIEKNFGEETMWNLGQQGELKIHVPNLSQADDIIWIHHETGRKIIEDNRIHLSNDLGWLTLTNNSVMIEDMGTYKALTRDKELLASTHVKVVHGAPAMRTRDFLEKKGTLGETLCLSLIIHDFDKQVKTIWKKKGDMIIDSKKKKKYKTRVDGDTHYLQIKNYCPDDNGEYTCHAIGLGGEESLTFCVKGPCTAPLFSSQASLRYSASEDAGYGSRQSFSTDSSNAKNGMMKPKSKFARMLNTVSKAVGRDNKPRRLTTKSLPMLDLGVIRSGSGFDVTKDVSAEHLIEDLTYEDIRKLEVPLNEMPLGEYNWLQLAYALETYCPVIDSNDVESIKSPGCPQNGKNLLNVVLNMNPDLTANDVGRIARKRDRNDIFAILKPYENMKVKDIPSSNRHELEMRLSLGEWETLATDLGVDIGKINMIRHAPRENANRSSVTELFTIMKTRVPTLSLPYLVDILLHIRLVNVAHVLKGIIASKPKKPIETLIL